MRYDRQPEYLCILKGLAEKSGRPHRFAVIGYCYDTRRKHIADFGEFLARMQTHRARLIALGANVAPLK